MKKDRPIRIRFDTNTTTYYVRDGKKIYSMGKVKPNAQVINQVFNIIGEEKKKRKKPKPKPEEPEEPETEQISPGMQLNIQPGLETKRARRLFVSKLLSVNNSDLAQPSDLPQATPEQLAQQQLNNNPLYRLADTAEQTLNTFNQVMQQQLMQSTGEQANDEGDEVIQPEQTEQPEQPEQPDEGNDDQPDEGNDEQPEQSTQPETTEIPDDEEEDEEKEEDEAIPGDAGNIEQVPIGDEVDDTRAEGEEITDKFLELTAEEPGASYNFPETDENTKTIAKEAKSKIHKIFIDEKAIIKNGRWSKKIQESTILRLFDVANNYRSRLVKDKILIPGLLNSKTYASIVNKTIEHLSKLRNKKIAIAGIKSFTNDILAKFNRTAPIYQKEEILAENILANIRGSGKKPSYGKAIDNQDINTLMQTVNNFCGVCLRQDILELMRNAAKEWRKFSFIYNTATAPPGEHWRAVYVDLLDDYQLCHYDSFGEIEPDIKKMLEKFLSSSDTPVKCKLKINRVPHQLEKSERCGYHCIRFLDDMNRGRDFLEATIIGEDRAKELENKYEKFSLH